MVPGDNDNNCKLMLKTCSDTNVLNVETYVEDAMTKDDIQITP